MGDGYEWEHIQLNIGSRAKLFNQLGIDNPKIEEGILTDEDIRRVDQIYREEVQRSNYAKLRKFLEKRWFCVYTPLLERLLPCSAWVALGYFEHLPDKAKQHWLYFTQAKNLSPVRRALSLIGNEDYFEKYIRQEAVIAYPLYEDIVAQEKKNLTDNCMVDRPLHIKLDASPIVLEDAYPLDFRLEWEQLESLGKYLPSSREIRTGDVFKFLELADYEMYWKEMSKSVQKIKFKSRNDILKGSADQDQLSSKLLRYLQIVYDSSKGKASHLLLVPAWKPLGKHRSVRSIAMVVCFNKARTLSSAKAISQFMAETIIANQLASNLFSLYALKLSSEELRVHGLRTAISAIMSRNGSHNLGSHVIFNVIKNIDNLNIQDNKYLYKYLQQRMDFLAQVATAWMPGWSSSSWLVTEMIKGFLSQSHLLNFIARSEGLAADRKNGKLRSIVKRVLKCATEKRCKKILTTEIKYQGGSPNEANLAFDLQDDILVSIPGGIIGFHAFYTIIENFIRNAAKHGFASLPKRFQGHKDLTINLEFEDNGSDSITVRIWDNISYITTMADECNSNKQVTLLLQYFEQSQGFKNGDTIKPSVTFSILFTREELLELPTAKNLKVLVLTFNDLPEKSIVCSMKYVRNLSELKTALTDNQFGFVIHPYGTEDCRCTNTECPPADDGSCQPIILDGFESMIKNEARIRFIRMPAWVSLIENLSPISDELSSAKDNLAGRILSFLRDHLIPLHKQMNAKLRKSLTGDDNKLRRENWGIGEIRICAGYLQGLDIKDVGRERDESEDLFIRAVAVPECCGMEPERVRAFRCGYQFSLKKPRDILIFGKRIDAQLEVELVKHSIFVREYSSLVKYDLFDSEIVIIVGEAVDLLVTEMKNDISFIERFPYRIIVDKLIDYEKEGLPEYVRKRIAVLTTVEREFESIRSSGNFDQFKQMMFATWVSFLAKQNLTDVEEVNLRLVMDQNKTLKVNTNNSEPDASPAADSNTVAENILEKSKLEIFCEKINYRTKGKVSDALADVYGIGKGKYDPDTLPLILQSNDMTSRGDNHFASFAFSDGVRFELQKEDDLRFHNNVISYAWHNLFKNKAIYDEDMSGASSHFPILRNMPEGPTLRNLCLRLLENGLLRIAVADERFWNYFVNERDFAQDLAYCNVYAVESVLSFRNEGIATAGYVYDIKRNLTGTIDYELILPRDGTEMQSRKPNILIIHQGILDKIKWKNFGFKNQQDFVEKIKLSSPMVIITSGRGEPLDLSGNVKFVGFSIIEDFLLSKPRSKFLLSGCLMKLLNRGMEIDEGANS